MDGDYRVLSTDYKSFAVVYSCDDYFGYKMEYLWILSRHPTIKKETLKEVFENLKQELPDYDLDNLQKTKQGEMCKTTDE